MRSLKLKQTKPVRP